MSRIARSRIARGFLCLVALALLVAPFVVGAEGDHPAPPPVVAAHGWHPPTIHEHGDAPPAWVVGSAFQPFTQDAESHIGYKGAFVAYDNGLESYFIAHILTVPSARSHGDHQYQLWMREPNGAVSYWEGWLDFSPTAVPSDPVPMRTYDTGERPIALAQGDGGCETWYSKPGANVVDVEWIVCGRVTNFAGESLGGVGLARLAGWGTYADRLRPGNPYGGVVSPTLVDNCTWSYGVCKLGFGTGNREYPGAETVVPVN